jgi:hypothetical protein
VFERLKILTKLCVEKLQQSTPLNLSQSAHLVLYIFTYVLQRVYNIKWELSDFASELQCCFLTKIRIV